MLYDHVETHGESRWVLANLSITIDWSEVIEDMEKRELRRDRDRRDRDPDLETRGVA